MASLPPNARRCDGCRTGLWNWLAGLPAVWHRRGHKAGYQAGANPPPVVSCRRLTMLAGDARTDVLAPASREVVVSLRGITVDFPLASGGVYRAVAETDLSVAAEEFVAIVGPTGCGKTTLLNATAGLLKPATGRVEVFGRPLAGINVRAGYLFQQDALMPWKSALDNVAISLEVAGVPRREAVERAHQWLTRVGLTAFTDRYPHMLSGGQKKRVGLAQVLIRDPKILLMDEPFGPLDAQTRQIMGNLLLRLWAADRKAVLFVTHDLEEAIALADRVVIMSAGPAAQIIGNWRVPLARPRDIGEVKLERAFVDLHREIWQMLKSEVLKGYARTGGG